MLPEACFFFSCVDGLPHAGVYAVLGRRRARVVLEEIREGSDLFSIHAFLPAQASFGFANDMRRQSSGDVLAACHALLAVALCNMASMAQARQVAHNTPASCFLFTCRACAGNPAVHPVAFTNLKQLLAPDCARHPAAL